MLELLAAVVIISLLASATLPSFRNAFARLRAHAALNLVVSEIYRGRMMAVQQGRPVRLVFSSNHNGCIEGVRVVLEAVPPHPEISSVRQWARGGPCMRHTGDSVVVLNSRGMLRPPTRSFFVSYGNVSDSVLVSIAGRVRRSYRRAFVQKIWGGLGGGARRGRRSSVVGHRSSVVSGRGVAPGSPGVASNWTDRSR